MTLRAPTGFYTHSLLESGPSDNLAYAPRRLAGVIDDVIAAGLHNQVRPVCIREGADLSDVLLAHDFAYIDRLDREFGRLPEGSEAVPQAYIAALMSVRAGIEAVSAVFEGKIHNAFCLMNPPGHHAGRASSGGFCLLNNAACAILYAMARLGVRRCVLIDFDAHHCDGTQDILGSLDGIQVYSSYESGLYGDTARSDPNVFKLALPMGSDASPLLHALGSQWADSVESFSPEVIFVSAGFDAHKEDEMSNLSFSDAEFSAIIRLIKNLAENICSGRLVSMLEGGYGARPLGRCALTHLKVLAGP